MKTDVEARVREAGLADTVSLDLAATIVPPGGPDQTIAGRPVSLGRPLPRLSVDLRAASDARDEGASAAPGTGTDIEVRALIGEGGMGRVLLARQHSLERDVAVKTAKLGAGESARASILTEGAITGQLEHPAIVPVHALGIDATGQPAMIMKRIEGVAWSELLCDPRHAGWEGWEGTPEDRLPGHLQILVAICNALHFAHSRGIVHRDVKPENILIGRFGDVYVADWGVAGRVGDGETRLCGTPGYMAPEMASGRGIDARTDVYLLGATLHEVLTGELRHPGSNLLAALSSALLSEPAVYEARAPRELAELANRACHVEPAERPASAQAFRDAIARYLRHRDSAALTDEAVERVAAAQRLASADALDEAARRELDRLVVEARFGLEQALAQWSANERAVRALAELEAIVEARRARVALLEEEARERDPTVDARPRALALGALSLVAFGMGLVAVMGTAQPTPMELVLYPSTVLGLIVGGAVVFRRRVLRTRFNRQMVACLLVMMGLMVTGRLLGLVEPIEQAQHFARDAFVMCAGCAMIGIGMLRWAGWLALYYAATGVACALVPDQSLRIFGVGSALAVLLASALSWRSRT